MKSVWLILLPCLLCGLVFYPLMSTAQETPRADPTASAPEAASLPPSAPPTTRPAAGPVAPLLPTFDAMRGHDGYWRIAKSPQGVWWFVSPEGRAEFLNTVTTVQPSLRGRDRTGPDFVSADWNPQGDHEGELDRWARATLKRVSEIGFKGLGAWSHPIMHNYNVPMTRDLNVWAWMRERSMRLFTPEWSTLAEATIRSQVEPLRENRNLVGYYIDNELDWSDYAAGPGAYFDELVVNDPNRMHVTQVMKSVWPELEQFNLAWGTQLKDWSELDGWRVLPRNVAPAYDKLGSAWLSHLTEAYFHTTTDLIRRHDPNHLILGVRFRGAAPPEVVAASKPYTDAQSLNYYVSDARLDREMFNMIHELSGQPLIITEYSFHALDGRSGNRNTVGFPAQVVDQEARAEGYKLFTSRLARVPFVIGADWFQWMDEPPSGRRNDGEDVNFGVVDVDDRAYEPLADAVRQTSPRLNPMHESSPGDDQIDLWRDTFATNLPSTQVPYLDRPVRLNGELSDWPTSARVNGMQTAQTVGGGREKVAAPNVYLGWTTDGVYIGLEVFDRDVVAAPANGWWWSRDSVEFFVSTRPVSSGQTRYDENCHHFFFVPTDGPGTGTSGVVGQWRSPGDALTQSLVPHPDARCAMRILPDRYVAEIFLPAHSLHGFDAATTPALGFNIHVRDYQHAREYFWSAPKQVLTQARPNTWGTAYLQHKPTAPADAPIAGVSADAK